MGNEISKEHIFYNAARNRYKNDYRALKKLKDKFRTWEKVWNGTDRGESKINPESEWLKAEKSDIGLVLENDPEFPILLREIPWPPFGVYFRGELPKNEVLSVAVVGTRKATGSGLETASRFGLELAQAGIGVASGLALGIDASAHKGCLEAHGHAIAVLGGGLDAIHPRSNGRLAEKIISSGGTLLSEYSPGTAPLPRYFLERNRLISGLSLGVVVIEAPEVSGSLATARFALEQNREIFVVPGPAGHPNFRGSHKLIRNGARLVTETAHVLEDLNLPSKGKNGNSIFSALESAEEKSVMETLKNFQTPLEVDKIAEITNLETRLVNESLTALLLKNLIKEEGEGYVINE